MSDEAQRGIAVHTAQSFAPQSIGLTGPPSGGSTVRAIYTIRDVRYFNINESEIDNLASLSVQGNFALSFAVLFISVGISIYINGVFYDQPIMAAQVAEHYIGPLLLILGVVCLIWLYIVQKHQTTIWKRVKEESRDS